MLTHLVADSDAHVVLPLGHQHLDVGELWAGAVGLHHGPHGVLEELEEDVVEVGRGID